MLFPWISRALKHLSAPASSPQRKSQFAPRVEAMEDRFLLNAGGLDPGFGIGGKVSFNIPGVDAEEIKAITRQSDGKIVVAGYATLPGNNRDFIVARYLNNGQLDPTFGLNGSGVITTDFQGGDDRALSVVVQPDGKIVAAGFATTGFGRVFGVARYTASGQPDVGNFGPNGITVNNLVSGAEAHGVALQADGKIVVGGWRDAAGQIDFAVGRFQANGNIDGAFGAAGVVTHDFTNGMDRIYSVVVRNGKILVGGATTDNNNMQFALARYDEDGVLDNTFSGDGLQVIDMGGVVDEIHSLAIQTDGKIVAAGHSVSATGEDFALVRLNTNGNLDGTFGTGGKVYTDFGGGSDAAHGVALGANGTIVAAGASILAGQSSIAVARYDANGDLDNGFGSGGKVTTQVNGVTSFANGVIVQPDGNIVAAGYTNTNGGDFAMVRLLGTDPNPPSPAKPAGNQPSSAMNDVTGHVFVQASRLRRTRRANRFRQVVNLVNAGNGAITGPLYLVLDGLRRRVKLRGVDVMTQKRSPLGSPGRAIVPGSDNVLRPGESVSVVLEFSSPLMRGIRYTPRVLAGAGSL